MNGLGVLALIAALVGGGWLLRRAARGDLAAGGRTVAIFKGVVWFALAAALFAAKLWPLAFMMLLAAGGVTAIELWRERTIQASGCDDGFAAPPDVSLSGKMSLNEAAAILGVDPTADQTTVKDAHRKLIAQLHPDKGGTDYLAAKINEARSVMIKATTPASQE